MTERSGPGAEIMGVFVHALSRREAMDRVLAWGAEHRPTSVAFVNTASLVDGLDNEPLREALNGTDLAVPDGMPVAKVLRKAGYPDQEQVAGPSFVEALLARCHEQGRSLALFGSTPEVIDKLSARIREEFPGARLVWAHSPPFRPLTEAERAEVFQALEQAEPEFVLVGLGCPKQEIWMHENREHIRSVLLGVGAAFEFSAGTVRRAPVWMRRSCLEWLHRLLSDPRRLAKRYGKVVPVFLYYWLTGKALRKRG